MGQRRPGGAPARMEADEERETLGQRWAAVLWVVLQDYMSSTSLHGYRYLTEPRRHWLERALWLAVHILAVWGVAVIVSAVWREFVESPTVTTVDSTSYPIWHVPFPAVAVCNINKISLRSARLLAAEISAAGNVSEPEALRLLRFLGRLYDHDVEGRENFQPLHHLLQRARGDRYNVTELMHSMNPTCEELLVRCSWNGAIKACGELFTSRKTMDGYCCAFNYLRASDDFVSEEAEAAAEGPQHGRYDWTEHAQAGLRGDMPGPARGLTVLVDPQPEDYFYPLLSAYGVKVLVFNPHDFPDTPSGGLVEQLISLRSEVFLRLEASSVFSTEGVRAFETRRRGCLFNSELRSLFAGYYSYSECLMNCRIRSITSLCRCVPFYLPARGNTRECRLMDIECLSRYREKWWTLRPERDVPGLAAEREESISCVECLPSCAETAYHVQASGAPIADRQFSRSPLLENITLGNHSVFHLFFGSFDSTLLKQDALYYWYELLGNFGGVGGLFVGFSLISVAEFVYFFTMRLFFEFRDRERERDEQRRRPVPPVMLVAAADPPKYGLASSDLYWREILPHY